MSAASRPDGLAVRRVPTSSLHLDPANAREHGPETRPPSKCQLPTASAPPDPPIPSLIRGAQERPHETSD